MVKIEPLEKLTESLESVQKKDGVKYRFYIIHPKYSAIKIENDPFKDFDKFKREYTSKAGIGVLIKNNNDDNYIANSWNEFVKYLEKENLVKKQLEKQTKEEIPKETNVLKPSVPKQEQTLLVQPESKKLENRVAETKPQTIEKKSTTPDLKAQEGQYQEILAKMKLSYRSIWRESGVLKTGEYNTAIEMLGDTQKHIKPGRRYFRITDEGKCEEIPPETAKSFLQKEAEKESKEPKKETTAPKNNSAETKTEREKEIEALQKNIAEKSKNP